MGKIFYMMGKSASGKDTIFKRVQEELPMLKTIVLYTTRPIREGEKDGVEYHFTDENRKRELELAGKLIESRTYDTVHGKWTYFTADDGQIDLNKDSYLVIGTLVSYEKMKEYFGEDAMEPIYIEVEDGERLKRAIAREETQETPKYEEMCRRFLADTQDFSEENIQRAEINHRFQNIDLNSCICNIETYLKSMI